MTKRPHVMKEPEDGFKSAEDSHKPHHHPSRNHVNRHHKKHEHANTIINPGATTVRSTVKQDRATEERVVSSTKENKSRFLNVTEATESGDTDTIATTSESTSSVISLSSSTSKPKKAPRRQKAREPVGNRTEVEDDKGQRRRKVHHHRRNNTLFTNSVHDEVPIVNVSETIETTTVTTAQSATSRSHRTRYTTTVPTTTMRETTIHRETVTGIGVTNDEFTKENTVGTNAQTILSTGSETSSETTESQTTTTTPSFTRTSTIIEGGRSRTTFPAVTTTSVTIPVTVSSNKRFPKVQKNRTNNLGPSRIDVTILESPDRRSRQGQ